MSPRTGRPKIENPKKKTLTLRLTADDLSMLDECSKALNVSKSELIRDQIKKVYASLEENK